jgi:hypothetical protein
MTIDKESLLLRLGRSTPSESVDLAKMLLASTEVKPLSEHAARGTVSEAVMLWRTRLNNVKHTKKPIQGVEWLLKRLETLGSEDELEQFSFTGREFHGSLFFAVNDHEFLGVVLVDRENAGDPSLKI